MSELPPDGWYDDPEGSGQERRWDGAAWTDEYRPKTERPARPAHGWYLTEVNKGSVNMRSLQGHLNMRRDGGYRLHSIFEQAGNTVMVFEHLSAGGHR